MIKLGLLFVILPVSISSFKMIQRRLIAERKAREEEERKKAVAVKLETLTQHEARIIGSENLCNSTMREGLEAIKKGIFTKGGIKKRDAVNKRLGKLDK